MKLHELVSVGAVADQIGCADLDECEVVYRSAAKHHMPLFWHQDAPFEEYLLKRDADRLISKYRKPATIIKFPTRAS